MNPSSQQQKRRDGALSLLDAAIEAMNLAKEISSMTPAKAVFGSVGILLTMIRDSVANKTDYVELGLACADVCRALDRGMNGKSLDDLSQSVCEAIAQLTTTVAEIQEKVIEKSGRSPPSRLVHARSDKDMIASWKVDLNRLLQVFTAELVMNTHTMVLDLHRSALAGREGADDKRHSAKARSATSNTVTVGSTSLLFRSIPLGELPPPQPRACFGRDELIEKVIDLAEKLTPIALIGAGGIGKTSIALTVLHHDRIKERFGENRRFIRCDQFPTSHTHFLSRLSKAVGAGAENLESLTPLRPFLSSREMVIVLDNAESILDPRGTHAQEIYAVVEELSQFNNICLCITSRISTVPPDCEILDIPTLPAEAARDAFYHICKNDERSNLVDNILEQLDFHPLSVMLLATVAHHNRWDNGRLVKEWEQQRTGVLQTEHNRSLAATIELSLASPMFQELGPDARELLGVIAFFPQGINEDNIDWLFPTKSTFSRLFPTLPKRKDVFNKFCVLSLTHRSNGFITMLAPLRDYLCPKDPMSSSLLRTTKKCYFNRLLVRVSPSDPGFETAQWITFEDANVEHLLDVFTTIDPNSDKVWRVCCYFMQHLNWHKARLVMLGPKIESLPDGHRSKPKCLFRLSQLFASVGNRVECKRLLIQALKLWRERGDDRWAAETLGFLSYANRRMGLRKEGIQQARESLEIYKKLNNKPGQAVAWRDLAWSLYDDEQLGAAEEAASRALDLLLNKGSQFQICQCHRLLGDIYRSKGETEKAIDHFETALGIASTSNWQTEHSRIDHSLAELFFGNKKFDDAHVHVERAKTYAINDPYCLGRAMELQARFWYEEGKFGEAKPEALHAADVYEKIGAVKDVERCRAMLRSMEVGVGESVTSSESDSNAHGTER